MARYHIAPSLRTLAVPIEGIREDPRNARAHDEANVEAIRRSLARYGQQKPIVIRPDLTCVAGSGTLRAARLLGWTELAVAVTDLGEGEAMGYAIADNRTAELASWNVDVLLGQVEAFDADPLELGFAAEDLLELAAQIEPDQEILEVEAELPESEPLAQLGDLWKLGPHRIWCGRCEDRLDELRELDLLLTDPPYGIGILEWHGGVGNTTRPFKGDKRRKIGGNGHRYKPFAGDDRPFDPSHLLELCRVRVLFGANFYAEHLPRGQWFVWDKTRPGNEGRVTTLGDAELGWTSIRRRAVRLFRCLWAGFQTEGESGKRCHPTQKPVKLMGELMSWADPGGKTVADPYLGSGSTLLAAEQLGRVCYGVELDPEYVDLAVSRWCELTGRTAEVER